MPLFKKLRDAIYECKNLNDTYEQVGECINDAARIAEEAIDNNPALSDIFGCDGDERRENNYVVGLAELAAIGSFDDEDIAEFQAWMCHEGNNYQTTIDLLTLKNGGTPGDQDSVKSKSDLEVGQAYAIKHGGSASDPIEDMQVWSDIQLIGSILGEDIAPLIWSDPLNSRFAMGFFPHRKGRESYPDYKAHELLTTIIFETLIGDPDRHEQNMVDFMHTASSSDPRGVIGHIDFSGKFTGTSEGATSRTVCGFYGAVKHQGIDFIEDNITPGIKVAIQEARRKWHDEWRGKLEGLHTTYGIKDPLDTSLPEWKRSQAITAREGFKGAGSIMAFTSPDRLEMVDLVLDSLHLGRIDDKMLVTHCYADPPMGFAGRDFDYSSDEQAERDREIDYAMGGLCIDAESLLQQIEDTLEGTGPLGASDPKCPGWLSNDIERMGEYVLDLERYADELGVGSPGCWVIEAWNKTVDMATCAAQVICDESHHKTATEGLQKHLETLRDIQTQINQVPMFEDERDHLINLRKQLRDSYQTMLDAIGTGGHWNRMGCAAHGGSVNAPRPTILDYAVMSEKFRVNYELHHQISQELGKAEAGVIQPVRGFTPSDEIGELHEWQPKYMRSIVEKAREDTDACIDYFTMEALVKMGGEWNKVHPEGPDITLDWAPGSHVMDRGICQQLIEYGALTQDTSGQWNFNPYTQDPGHAEIERQADYDAAADWALNCVANERYGDLLSRMEAINAKKGQGQPKIPQIAFDRLVDAGHVKPETATFDEQILLHRARARACFWIFTLEERKNLGIRTEIPFVEPEFLPRTPADDKWLADPVRDNIFACVKEYNYGELIGKVERWNARMERMGRLDNIDLGPLLTTSGDFRPMPPNEQEEWQYELCKDALENEALRIIPGRIGSDKFDWAI